MRPYFGLCEGLDTLVREVPSKETFSKIRCITQFYKERMRREMEATHEEMKGLMTDGPMTV